MHSCIQIQIVGDNKIILKFGLRMIFSVDNTEQSLLELVKYVLKNNYSIFNVIPYFY